MAGKDKKDEDRKRSGNSDDIMGISHGGGRDQYGGSFGGGQSGGGAYANPHTDEPPGQGGTRAGSYHDDLDSTGGSSNQAYYGGGQMGDRNYSDRDHNQASTAGGPDEGHATYADSPGQHGGPVRDRLSKETGFDEHAGFGAEHRGQTEQGREHGGPHLQPDPEPGFSLRDEDKPDARKGRTGPKAE